MKVAQPSKHMIFTGPPGTGKTTIARVVANVLAGLGVIGEPKLVETSRKDFVAEYEGQSAVKTTKAIDRAIGGVLFIDEANALVQERDGRTDPFRIAKVIAASNDSALRLEATENQLQAAKLLSQRTVRGKAALDIAGNGRYAPTDGGRRTGP